MNISLEQLNMPGYLYLNQDVLDEMKQLSGGVGEGTVDELGFGSLYNKIAEALFPWCSTLTTRARYFFFTLCVLDLALTEVIDAKEVNSAVDPSALNRLPVDKEEKFIAVIRRIEKALSLSLVLKEHKAKGVFGTRNTKEYLDKPGWTVKKYKKILSLDSRYPNAIYRGSCKTLKMFNSTSLNLGILSLKLKGQKVFDAGWVTASTACRAEIKALDLFWLEHDSDTFENARKKFLKIQAFKNFKGFKLIDIEAQFLFNKIKEISLYLNSLSTPTLRKIINSDNLNLKLLQKNVQGKRQKQLIEAAYHINIATSEFRALYEAYCTMNIKINTMKISKASIAKSIKWLNDNAKFFLGNEEWGEAWNIDLGVMLNDWLSSVSKSGFATENLMEKLCHRADVIVSLRGIGKKAPHKKRKKNNLKSELDFVRESSFRLWNGAIILKDILDGIDKS